MPAPRLAVCFAPQLSVAVALAMSLLSSAASAGGDGAPRPPIVIADAPLTRPVLMPDGRLIAYRTERGGQQLVAITSADGGNTWGPPVAVAPLPLPGMGGGIACLDGDGRTHVILTHLRGTGTPGDTRFIDLWHLATENDAANDDAANETNETWTAAQRIWEGYCGAVMEIQQLSTGRIVVPFAAWKRPGEVVAPDTGSNYTTAVYSEDGGATWELSASKLTSPCAAGFNGNNYGAIEPTLLERADGRAWILMRTQTRELYESFSRDGAQWTPAAPSRFLSSSSPAALVRLPDRRIVVFWNHCQQPPRHEGDGVYGGRDALHATISSDEGATWHGFREIYRDPFRNESPPHQGDRGTAYPLATVNADGDVILVTGQGNRRAMLRIDPEWLLEQEQTDDFSDGLAAWHVWKPFGPAERYWRDRTVGAELVQHPGDAARRVLHVRRPDELDPDTAIWSFPRTTNGRLAVRMRKQAGSQGQALSLVDRFFDPNDDRALASAFATAHIDADGRLGADTRLEPDAWHTVEFRWSVAPPSCRIYLDGALAADLATGEIQPGTASYLRLHSTAETVDRAGYLIESVEVFAAPDAEKQ